MARPKERPSPSVSPVPSGSEGDEVAIMGTRYNRIREDDSRIESMPEENPSVDDPVIKVPWGHPDSCSVRGSALVLMCFMGFGSYFCYDNPGALQNEIKTAMSVSTYEFENLYAWYSWPNVILPIVGGYFVDHVFGMRVSAFMFATFLVLGQILTSLGAFYESFTLMVFSRFVFGLGGESLLVVQNTYASAWFKGNILNFVFGFQTSVARVGSTVNFMVVEPLFASLRSLYDQERALGWTFVISGITCIVSLLCSIVLAFLDKRREKYTLQPKETVPRVDLRHLLVFPTSFWLICLICVSYYVAIFPFVTLGKVFFEEKYHFSGKNANFITGLLYLMSAVLSPILGGLIDLLGCNISFVLISVFTTLFSHVLLAFSEFNPYFSIVPMGVGYSMLCSSLWPMIALSVPLSRQGTAFGLMQAIQNFGLALISLLVGLIVDSYGYLWLEVFFICWLSLATIATIGLWIVDKSWGNGYLNMTVTQRKTFESTEAARVASEFSALLSATGDQVVF